MITQKFKEEYKRLNQKQKEAVDTIEGPVMVIAGPGTGKTTILTLRIANILLKTDTPPSGILALTFTDAGAKAMRRKLQEIIGETALQVPIHTFHSFAASVIAEFQDHFPHLARSKQITEVETESLLRDILKQEKFRKLRPLGEPDFYIPKIVGTVSDAKQEAWTPEMLRSFAREEIDRVKNDPDSISSRGATKGQLKGEALKRIEKCERTLIFADAYEAYENRKKEERKIDFDDLIFELLQALRQDKLLLQILQEKFLYILLDEHQDTNDAQNLLVRTIADFFESPNLFVVGDEKQAIYRFQGASVANFLNFQQIWSQMKVISLTDNYRSHQYILDNAFGMIERNYEGSEHQNLRVKLKSGGKVKEKPLDLIIAKNIEVEENHLVEKLQTLIKDKPDDSVAIIVRTNNEVGRIFALLEQTGIPATAERGANIFAHPVGLLYFALLEFLADPSNTESLGLTFAGGLWHLEFAEQAQMIKWARADNLTEITATIPDIPNLQKAIADSGTIEYLTLAAEVSGFTEVAVKSPLAMEIWRGIIALAEDLIRAKNIESPRLLIQELLDYKKLAERKTIKLQAGQTDSQITIMTAHGSKGLEFDYVFLPYATEESWIRKSRGSYFVLPKEKGEEDDVRDDRRLFYVALTRARQHVMLSYSLADGLGKGLTPLRFLDELDSNLIAQTQISEMRALLKSKNLADKKASQMMAEIEYAKQVLLEKGLSVTALNHFMDCPSDFYYKSILKIPEAPSPSSEKGNAMHEALANVWNNLTPSPSPRSRRGEKEIRDIIETSVKDYFKRSLLARFEREAILEELLTNAPIVAKALQEHFSQTGNISTESWVETPFKFIFDGKEIEIMIHGKLDAMIEPNFAKATTGKHENKILVYDYKTREAMSVNAIKGETQSSDGNYFRQLIFYKMLLEGNNKFKNKVIEPALVFVKPHSKGGLGSPKPGGGDCPTISVPIQKSDIDRVKSEVTTLLETVWSGTLLTIPCDDDKCEYCKYRKLL